MARNLKLLALLLVLSLPVMGQTELQQINQKLPEIYKQKRWDDALPLVRRALELYEQEKGPNHPHTLEQMGILAGLYIKLGQLEAAESLHKQRLRRAQEVDPDGLLVARALLVYSEFLQDSWRHPESLAAAQGAVDIRKRVLGDHAETAAALKTLATRTFNSGAQVEGEKLMLQAVQMQKRVLPADSLELAHSRVELGYHRIELGRAAAADQVLEKARSVLEKKAPPDHKTRLQLDFVTGRLRIAQNRPADAVKLLTRLIPIYAQWKDRRLVPAHSWLGAAYRDLRRLDLAEQHFKQAMEIDLNARDEFGASITMSAYGGFLVNIGADQRALKILEQALENNRRQGSDTHPYVIDTLLNIWVCHTRSNHNPEALQAAQQALRVAQSTGNQNGELRALKCLGVTATRQGDHKRARDYYFQAYEVAKKNGVPPSGWRDLMLAWANTEFMGGRPKESVRLLQEILTDNPAPDPFSLTLLSASLFRIGKKDEALKVAHQSEEALYKDLAEVLSFAPEEQRRDYLARRHNPYLLYAVMDSPSDLARMVLRFKGLVLDSMMEDRRAVLSANRPELVDKLEQIRQLKTEMQSLHSPQEQERLSAAARELESELTRQLPGRKRRRALQVTVAEVQARLPANSALVEYFVFNNHMGTDVWKQRRFGALVLTAQAEPRWVNLGSVEELGRPLRLFRRAAFNGDDRVAGVLLELHHKLWEPLASLLPSGTQTVFISPDAELNFLNFALLTGPDGTFLSERYKLRLLSSGRDLLTPPRAPVANPRVMAFGSPLFEMKPADQEKPLAELKPLPGSARECQQLAKLWQEWNWRAEVRLAAQASESSLRKTGQVDILHFATHGFFLSEGPELQDPLRRSGLALAGGRDTMKAWKRGQPSNPLDDGILTAAEVGELDLGAELAVLSACDTGLGEISQGDGVLGLRRGFHQAGVTSLLMTLWPVADESTADFMADFYRAYHQQRDAAAALDTVRSDWLRRVTNEAGVGQAIRLAGPFMVNSY